MKPSGKISMSSLGIFCLWVLILSPQFDLAQAVPTGNGISNKGAENSILNSTVPGEERGGHFEGDMILPELAATSGIRDESKRWPDAVVIYQMDSEFSEDEVDVIKGAMDEISDKTCVQFKARADESAYVKIVRGQVNSGCNSHVGYLGYAQELNLEPKYPNSTGTCIDHGTVVHEILHTLGFFHEQSRTDRDDFVTINAANVQPEIFSANFQKYGLDYITDFNISYDYNSIMHYGASSFAVNPSIPTIIPKDPNAKIGQRKKLSEKDVQKINAMYKCKSEKKVVDLTLESKMEMMQKQTETGRKQTEMMQKQTETMRQKMSEMEIKLEKNEKAAQSYAQIFKARLYSGVNFTGLAEDYNVSPNYYDTNCHNLQKISGNVKSINTFDTCVRLYLKRDCIGSMRAFLPGLNDHKNISNRSFVSVGPCFEVPLFGRSIETLKNGLEAVLRTAPKARFYSQLNQTGQIEEYNIGGSAGAACKNLETLAGKVKSVDNLGTCVRLFTGSDCTVMFYQVSPLTSVETRDNILSYVTQGVASVGPCWELPYGEHYLGKLKSRLDKISTTS